MEKLHDKHFQNVIRLSKEQRYRYLVDQVADQERIWSLKNSDGWVLLGKGTDCEVAPFWSHGEYAAACATGAWQGTRPESISLEDFLEKWIPGLEKDGRLVSAFPTPHNEGLVFSANRFGRDLMAACEALGDSFSDEAIDYSSADFRLGQQAKKPKLP